MPTPSPSAHLRTGAVPVTAHSHFRYGTIHWEPGERAYEAIFTVNAAFRKQYNWGAYHKVRSRCPVH